MRKFKSVTLSTLLLFFILSLLNTSSAKILPDGTLVYKVLSGKQNDILVYTVQYFSDGLKVKGKLFIPQNPPSKKMPALVYNHDGISGAGKFTQAFCRKLAKVGFVVIAPSFRGEDGSEGQIEIAKGEVTDALNSIKVLKKLSLVDENKIGMLGTSHGALISILAVQRQQESEVILNPEDAPIKAVAEIYGVMNIVDWWCYLKENNMVGGDKISERIYGKGPEDKPESFKVRNAILEAEKINCPVLIIQGEDDKIVPLEQAQLFEKALEKYNKTFEIYIYPKTNHGFLIYDFDDGSSEEKEAKADAFQKIVEFFRKHLQ